MTSDKIETISLAALAGLAIISGLAARCWRLWLEHKEVLAGLRVPTYYFAAEPDTKLKAEQ